MARIDTLENFLVDVATAIKEKRHLDPASKFRAEIFDTEILKIDSSGDTSDATATASDILEPKTAYANGKKLYGTLKTEYQDSDINLYYMMINSMYNETIIYSRTLKLYDIVFIASISSTKLYLHAIKNNKIEALQEFDLSENGFYANSSMVGISYDATHTTADNIDLVIFTERNTTSGKNFSFYQRWVKFLYDTGERTFTKNSTYYNRSDTRYGNTGDRYHVDGFADIEPDILFPNYFHLMDNFEDYGPHCYWNIINLQWDDEGTPRATTLKSFNNFANISAYDNMYITGDGNYLTYRQGVFKLNGQRTNTDGGITNQSTPVFISHNLKYIVNNRYLYKCNGDLNISTNWSSRIQIGAQLPSYNVIYFSENDNYMILTSNNYIYVYRINAELNDYILVQQFNSNSTFQTKNIVWNSNYMHNFDNSNLTETFYDCSGEKILKRIIKEDIVYEYVLPEEVPSSTNNVLIGNKYFDGNRVLEGSMPNNGPMNITPSTSEQSIPAGYTSGGTVSAVTSAIDSNIQADNIKEGVEILGVTGTFMPEGGDATSDANLQDKYLLEGYSAVKDGTLIQGTMINYGTTTIQRTSEVQEIPTGYYDLLTIPVAQASNLDGYDECLNALKYVNNCELDNYTELNYIESTGNQFIDIDYVPKTLHTKYELGFMRLSVNGNWNPVINNEEDVRFGIMCTKDEKSNRNYGQFHIGTQDNMQSVTFPIQNNVKYDIVADKTGISLNGTKYEITGNVVNATGLWGACINHRRSSATEFSPEYSLGRWYYLKIYEDGILVKNLIPVINNKNNNICLYDKLNKRFHYNIGSGNFVSGGVKV